MSFPTTRWTLLANATLHGDPAGRQALETLCLQYRRPVIAYLHGCGLNGPMSEDMAQAFFLHLLESRVWKKAERSRGTFRAFLIGVLKNVISAQRQKDGALKRGGGETVLSLERLNDEGTEFAEGDTDAVRHFDRAWALSVLYEAHSRLAGEYASDGRTRAFEILRVYLPCGCVPPSYEVTAGLLGVPLPAVNTLVHRLRGRFRDHLRAVVARTVSAPHEIDEELAHLRSILADGAIKLPS